MKTGVYKCSGRKVHLETKHEVFTEFVFLNQGWPDSMEVIEHSKRAIDNGDYFFVPKILTYIGECEIGD